MSYATFLYADINYVEQFTRPYQVSDAQLSNEYGLDPISHCQHRVFVYIRLSTLWPTGTRIRTKKLSVHRALSYVNKLHEGKWVDDDTYHVMYCVVDELCQRLLGGSGAPNQWSKAALGRSL